jgi:hypothetical protein
MSKTNGNNLAAANPAFVVGVPDGAGLGGIGADMVNYRNNAVVVNQLMSIVDGGGNVPTSSANPQLSQGNSALSEGAGGLYNLLQGFLKPNDDNPLVSLVSFGQKLIMTGIITYATTMALILVMVGIAAALGTIVLGTGAPGAFSVGATAGNMIFMAAMAFVSFCITFGGLLSVYTPLIPYIIFTFAAIGWFTAVIEAMVATPFIALGILAPGGQSEMLGHAGHSIMLLLNLILRPSLMIMGLMFAMLLAGVAVTMVNAGFNQVVGIVHSGGDELIAPILFIIAYTFLIIGVLSKCFDLIHWLPNHALTWIGGHATSYGEEGALASVQRGFEGGASAMGGAASGAGGAMKGGITGNSTPNKPPPAPDADTGGAGSQGGK